MANNIILSGKYEGLHIVNIPQRNKYGGIQNVLKLGDIELNENTIASINLIDKQNVNDTGSAIARGLVGGTILGGAGLIAGTITGKKDEANTIEIIYKTGEKSFALVNSDIYKCLLKIDWNIKNNINTSSNEYISLKYQKRKIVALLLCIFLGGVSAHRFYLGYSFIPIVMTIFFVLALVLNANALNFLYHLPYLIWIGLWITDIVLLSKNKLKTVAGDILI